MSVSPATIRGSEPAPGKSCGSCTLCCKVLGITALQKPEGKWCQHCTPGVGCRMYEQRPDECRSFFCLWLVDPGLGPEWKPERSKFVLTASAEGNRMDIHCDPGYPHAWRREPYRQRVQEWALAARPSGGTVMVRVGKDTSLVAPEGEFPLGEVAEEDRIVSEFEGSRLVAARAVKPSDPDFPKIP